MLQELRLQAILRLPSCLDEDASSIELLCHLRVLYGGRLLLQI